MNILLQDKFTYDLKSLNTEIEQALFLLLITLYTPKDLLPYKKRYGCSLYENISKLDVTEDVLNDMRDMAELLNIQEYYNSATKLISSITIEDIIKYNIDNNEMVIMRNYDVTDLNPTYTYTKGIIVNIDFYSGDNIEIIL